jgi:L-lactate dehydrogenase complex protein LldG
MPREDILQKVRTALRRDAGQQPTAVPEVHLLASETAPEERIRQFCECIESLSGKAYCANSRADACAYASSLLGKGTAIASNTPLTRECGITALPGVQTGPFNEEELRRLCAAADLGITGADYALADTGTLVLLASAEEASMISLLPPVHLAIVSRDRILSGLDELFQILPRPDQRTSSMVLITGSSRTADIEQILIRGVHGPGELHIVIL